MALSSLKYAALLLLAGTLATGFNAEAYQPDAVTLKDGRVVQVHGYKEAEAYIAKLRVANPGFAAEIDKAREPGGWLDDASEFRRLIDKRLSLITTITNIGVKKKEYTKFAFDVLKDMYRISAEHEKNSTSPFDDQSFTRDDIMYRVFEIAEGGSYGPPNIALVNPAADFFETVLETDPDEWVRDKALLGFSVMTRLDTALVPRFREILDKYKDDPQIRSMVDVHRSLLDGKKLDSPRP